MLSAIESTFNKVNAHPLRKSFYFIPLCPQPTITINDIFLSKLKISEYDSKYMIKHKAKLYNYFSEKYGNIITEDPIYWYIGTLTKAAVFTTTGVYFDIDLFVIYGGYKLFELLIDNFTESGTNKNMLIKYKDIEE